MKYYRRNVLSSKKQFQQFPKIQPQYYRRLFIFTIGTGWVQKHTGDRRPDRRGASEWSVKSNKDN